MAATWARAMSTAQLRARDLPVRRAARVLVVDPADRVLLFQYRHRGNDALRDKGSYFTLPGGKARPGESFAACAQRELREETGLALPVGRALARRQAPMLLPAGTFALAAEEYFAVFVDADQALDTSRWTAHEQQHIAGLAWYTAAELAGLRNLWPGTLPEILASARTSTAVLDYQSTREQIGELEVLVSYD